MTGPAPSPAWFPHLLDPINDRVLLVRKSEEEYRDAAFLDERSLRPDGERQVVDWSVLAQSVPAEARRDVQYIFHIGHVGSTLISRLLGELPDVLALREPLIIRTMDEMLAERGQPEALWDPASLPARLDVMTALLSRTFRAEQRAMAKATSFTSESAAELVPAGSKALLLHVSPQRYIETILAGENSRRNLRATAPARLKRLHRRSGEHRWNLWEMSEGARTAMAWAAETTSLARAEEALPQGAAFWMDFDSFLAAPAESLQALAAFFGARLGAEEADGLARHPLMGRYSKATEHEYGARQREELLAEVRRDHAEAIADGLRWLEEAARDIPAIARCLESPARPR
ncbi:MAG: hypothetical protein QOH81_500 [Sphingomonadales bacterium]|jgi:hypothetical protein|nr:hypothetical protein [Sphingomonadales bacterium]